jgi:hypothetical protein
VPIRTFEEFIAACAAHRGGGVEGSADSPYPSSEPVEAAVRRWWGDVVSLEVIGPDRYRWVCTGCGSAVECSDESLPEWDLFDFVLWEHCMTCEPALHEDAGDANE